MASLDQLHERQGDQERAADHRALLDWITLANVGFNRATSLTSGEQEPERGS
jgi:hypothetical protein